MIVLIHQVLQLRPGCQNLYQPSPNAKKEDLEHIASVALSIDEAACLLLDKEGVIEGENSGTLEEIIDQFVKKNKLPGEENIEV